MLLPAPGGMPAEAWRVAGLVVWMAAWWMTEAVPLTVTGLLPFVVLPFSGGGTAGDVAGDYYSPIMFLLLGGAFIALAIERTGLHRRLATFILDRIGGRRRHLRPAARLHDCRGDPVEADLQHLDRADHDADGAGGAGGRTGRASGDGYVPQDGIYGALPMGIAFAASIGGLGTIVGSPTNAIGVALLRDISGIEITFADVGRVRRAHRDRCGVPLAAWIIARVQQVAQHPFDIAAARDAIDPHGPWTRAERRLVPVIALTFVAWMLRGWIAPYLPEGSLTDGTDRHRRKPGAVRAARRDRPPPAGMARSQPRAVGRDHDVRRRAGAGGRHDAHRAWPTGWARRCCRSAPCR